MKKIRKDNKKTVRVLNSIGIYLDMLKDGDIVVLSDKSELCVHIDKSGAFTFYDREDTL